MTVWVDADSCPKPVRELLIRASSKRKILTIFVADRRLPLPNSRYIRQVIVESKDNSADHEIVASATEADLVVTRDIPLASELLKKGVSAIDDRGGVFTPDNIGERLSMRNLMYDLREQGVQAERTRPASAKDLNYFANAYDREVTRLSRNEES